MRFVTVVALAAVLPLAAHPAAARTWEEHWAVGSHPRVQVETNDARVRLHRGVPGQVAARVEYLVNVWGFHSSIQPPSVVFEHDGDAIKVVARSRSSVVVFGGVNERFQVDVTLPPECDVTVRTGDGSVESEPLAGRLDLQTGDGHITAHGAHGIVRLHTGDGAIEADGADGTLDASTSDGHIRVDGRFDALGVHTGDGRVEVSVARGSRLAQPWSVGTGDGRVAVRIPRDLQALLDVATRDGLVHVELPIDTGERHHRELRGQLNGGTLPLKIRTGDGSITLGLSE